MKSTIAFLFLALIASSMAFAPVNNNQVTRSSRSSLQSTKNSFDPFNITDNNNKNTIKSVSKIAVSSAAAFAIYPVVAMAGTCMFFSFVIIPCEKKTHIYVKET